MEKRNRYRNPVQFASVFRVIFICLLVGLIGAAFVYIKNRHIRQGDEIHNLENRIVELDHEKQLWELRIAGAKDRVELARRLKWMGSDLTSIDPSRVLKIQVDPLQETEPDEETAP